MSTASEWLSVKACLIGVLVDTASGLLVGREEVEGSAPPFLLCVDMQQCVVNDGLPSLSGFQATNGVLQC
jgi:hypothetical protein